MTLLSGMEMLNLTNYSKFEGKIIRMNKPYPITNSVWFSK